MYSYSYIAKFWMIKMWFPRFKSKLEKVCPAIATGYTVIFPGVGTDCYTLRV